METNQSNNNEDWELLTKPETVEPNIVSTVGESKLRGSLTSNPFGIFNFSVPEEPKPLQDWMSDLTNPKPVIDNDDIFAPLTQQKPTFDDAFSATASGVPAVVLYQAKCLFDFTPGRPDDLPLSSGAIVSVLKEDGEWLFGFTSTAPDQKGWFPHNFIEVFDGNKNKEEVTSPVPITQLIEPIGTVKAIFDYTASRDDELTVKKDELLTVFDKSGGDWWNVMDDSGNRGLVPSSYVTEQPLEEPMEFSPIPIEKEYSLRVSLNGSQDQDAFLFSSVPTMTRGSASQQAVSTEGFQHWVSVVDPYLLGQLSVEEKKRQEAIFELIQTEAHYLRDLQLILEVFYQPMAAFLSDTDLRTIFCNVEDLMMTNTVIFSDLESAQKEQHFIVNNIGELFQRHAPALDGYETYCGNQGVASRMLQKRRQENLSLQEFLKNCQRNPRCRSLDLSSFLLIPMQRITRYIILLKQILHYTPATHPEHDSVSRAVDLADRVAERVNTAVMAVESRDKLEAINSQVDFNGSEFMPVDILSLTRTGAPRGYLFESHLAKSKSGKKLYGFILSDMILIVQPQSNLNIFKDRSFAYSMYHAPIMIQNATVRDVPRALIGTRDVGNVDDTTFQIVQGDEVLTLKAPSTSIKNKWLSYHETALRQM
ncbi:Dbl homology domain-containing protein, partial [Chytriomyces sp. MP71]